MRPRLAAAIGVAAAAGAFRKNAPALSPEYADVDAEALSDSLIRGPLGRR
ncbi:MAG TPA: hypothetical protein VKE51_06465 [Vicinamibacterales bacterium]|nr:hypothetical protein [Vicinamibacterales bacterium]